MKQTILTIFFAIIALGANAQSPISFQVKAGVGTSNFYGENVESDTRIAYKVGVGMNYEFNRTWVFQPSLNFVSIGAREEVEYVNPAKRNGAPYKNETYPIIQKRNVHKKRWA